MTQTPLSQKTKKALLFSISKMLQEFNCNKIEKTRIENSLKAANIYFVATLVTFAIKYIKKFNQIGKKSIGGIMSFYEKYGIQQEKVGPIMDEFFKRMESISHEEIPGLVSSKHFKNLMKVAEHYGCSEIQLLQNKNIGIQFTTRWSAKLLHIMSDRKGRRLAQPLCERVQQRVNRYIKRELKLFLNTVQV